MTGHEISIRESSARGRVQCLGFAVGICLGVIVAFYCTVGAAAGPEKPPVGLAGTLNPNTAPLVSLMRLPRVGLTRARAIIAFRDRYREQNRREAPFRCPDDLQQITGIGPKTIQDIAGWLRFEQTGDESAGEGRNSPSQR